MKKRLLSVQGTLQFVAGYNAFTWVSKSIEGSTEDTLLLYDFLCHKDVGLQIANTVLKLSKIHNWKRVVYIDSLQMGSLTKCRYSRSIKKLITIIGEQAFDEVFLARDHVGFGSELILNAYSDSKKYIYGDSFGLVGQKESMSRLYPISVLGHLAKVARKIILGGPKKIAFDSAVLCIPIDVSGIYLNTISLNIPSREHVTGVINNLYNILPDFKEYCESIKTTVKCRVNFLILLSNLSASGLSTVESEVELYIEIIRETARFGDTLLLKPHPRSSFDVLNMVWNKLRHEYDVIIISDERFSRIPIELWVDLFQCCNLVSIFSTSAINIRYIFEKEVKIPLNDDRILQYIKSSGAVHVATVNNFVNEAIEKIEDWDRKSPLWKPRL